MVFLATPYDFNNFKRGRNFRISHANYKSLVLPLAIKRKKLSNLYLNFFPIFQSFLLFFLLYALYTRNKLWLLLRHFRCYARNMICRFDLIGWPGISVFVNFVKARIWSNSTLQSKYRQGRIVMENLSKSVLDTCYENWLCNITCFAVW